MKPLKSFMVLASLFVMYMAAAQELLRTEGVYYEFPFYEADGKILTKTLIVKFKEPLNLDYSRVHFQGAEVFDQRREFAEHIEDFYKRESVAEQDIHFKLVYGDFIEREIQNEKFRRFLPELFKTYLLTFPQPVDHKALIARLQNCGEIEYVHQGASMWLLSGDSDPPNDPLYPTQWHLEKVQAEGAWDISTGQVPGGEIRVAIIEPGGVWQDHEDIQGKIVGGDTQYYSSHGIEVAGVAGAATNNNLGIASLGWDIKLLTYKVSSSPVIVNTEPALVASGIDRAVADGADIMNFSFYTGEEQIIPGVGKVWVHTSYPAIEDAINRALAADVVLVAGAGNTGIPPWGYPWIQWPVAYPDVIGVSGTTQADEFISGYNYGDLVDVSAPAKDILTTTIWAGSGDYGPFTGTSYSCPLVAALTALIKATLPPEDFSREKIEEILAQSAEKIGGVTYSSDPNHPYSTWNDHYGYGRINAYHALFYAIANISNINASAYLLDVTLSWGAVPHAEGYHIYRSSSSGGPYTLVGSTTQPNFIDTVPDKGYYYYQVKAYIDNGAFEGPASDIILVHVLHMQSTSAQATAYNNGRRVVRDGEGTLHAVYVDGRQTWYTYSDDDGVTWAPETRIDDLLVFDVYKHQYPSIAEIDGTLHVAWTLVSYIDEEPADAQVQYRMKYINQGQWEPAKNVGLTISPVTTVPKPAIDLIDVVEGRYVIIRYNKVDAVSEIVTYYKEVESDNFQSSPGISGIDPSLGANEDNQSLYVTYESGGEVYIRKWEQPQWLGAHLLSGDPWWLSWNRYSNTTFHGGSDQLSYAVWAAQDDSGRYLDYQQTPGFYLQKGHHRRASHPAPGKPGCRQPLAAIQQPTAHPADQRSAQRYCPV